MPEAKIPMENFKAANIEPKEGGKVALDVGGKAVEATIKKVEKDSVTVEVKQQ